MLLCGFLCDRKTKIDQNTIESMGPISGVDIIWRLLNAMRLQHRPDKNCLPVRIGPKSKFSMFFVCFLDPNLFGTEELEMHLT